MECLILSNRLPVQWNSSEKKFQPSSGGLVSAIKGIKSKTIKFSWCGILPEDADESLLPQSPFPCLPIKIPEQTYDQYYNGFCNDVLWPLFHYEHSLVRYSAKAWLAYVSVNEQVATKLADSLENDTFVWVQDFHFMLVPKLLKDKRPDIKIGFFLHIPFPSSEIFRQLPCRMELLNGVIASDLIGFHDLSYLTHFQSSVRRLLGHDPEATMLELPYHVVHFGVFPISIDTEFFEKLSNSIEVVQEEKMLKVEKGTCQQILGIDRLDYIKGLVLKLQTFQRLLRRYPQHRGKLQLRQIVIPSRTDVHEYQKLKNKVDQLVGSINGEFGDINYVPVLYHFGSVNQVRLSALYRNADAIWVSSRRDGMNLVCLEYVASQPQDNPGIVLLSEFTGAHSTLSYAHSLNPWDVEGTADKINLAFATSLEDKRFRMETMKNFLKGYTASHWADNFLSAIPNNKQSNQRKTKEINSTTLTNLVSDQSHLFLDYDGTLVPIREKPELALPDERLLETLMLLQKQGKHLPCLVSGRPEAFFDEHFISKGFHLPIAASHGASFFDIETKKWRQLVDQKPGNWYKIVRNIFKIYSARTPGSFLEEKPYGLAWHYRKSPADFAEFVAKKLTIELHESMAGEPVHVINGKKVIEVKHQQANKGRFLEWYLARQSNPHSIFVVGDDETDEDMFRSMQRPKLATGTSIKVGTGQTLAQWRLQSPADVRNWLDDLKQLS